MKTTITILVSFVVFGWISAASAVPIEWTVASGGNGHFYEAVDTGSQLSWQSAKGLAEAAGGHLATVTSIQEHDWVVANLIPLISGTGEDDRLGPWIGGFQDTSSPSYSEPAGGWTWITAAPAAMYPRPICGSAVLRTACAWDKARRAP